MSILLRHRVFVLFVSIVLAGSAYAQGPLPAIPAIPGQGLFISQLVRVSDSNTPSGNPLLGFFGNVTGIDPLSEGQVSVGRNRQTTFQLRGAASASTYSSFFCRFGFQFALGCITVGQFTTDGRGDADATLAFPGGVAGPDHWAGAFVLLRNTGALTVEFLSGFSFPPTPPTPSKGVELQLTGQIQSTNPANVSFRLAGLPIDIVTGETTKFQGGGIHVFTDLKLANVVQVSGFTQPDGTIFATDVQFKAEKDSGDGKGKGKGDE